MRKLFGVALLVFALGIAVIPQYTNCDHFGSSLTTTAGKSVPMKCKWTAQGEIAVALPLAVVGVMTVTSRRRESQRNLAVMGVVLGALAVALPTSLIGTCTSQMPCNLIMKPSLIGMGTIVGAANLVGLVISIRSREKDV